MKRTGSPKTYATWNKALPILLLSGQDDPVGDCGKGVTAVHKAMTAAGFDDVQSVLYPNARHDLLHEEESGMAAKAREQILTWLNAYI